MATQQRRCADEDPDPAGIGLVRRARSAGIHHPATLDLADFSLHRLHGRKRFERVRLH